MDGRGAAEDDERLQEKGCDQQSLFLARIWNQALNPRISALFCRLAVRLAEQVCVSVAGAGSAQQSTSLLCEVFPVGAVPPPWSCVFETTTVLVNQDHGRETLLQFQWANLFPMVIFVSKI